MSKKLLKDGLFWGFILWLIGYFLGIVLFMLVPANLMGWVITPIGIAITLWVLLKKINYKKLKSYFKLGAIWTAIAILFDYIFIVLLFSSSDYYKLDIYFYYLFTFTLPVLVGLYKRSKR